LRHIERNAVLLFMIPADSDDIKRDYEILLKELHEFNPELDDKCKVLAISKSDMLDEELREGITLELPEGVPMVFISAVTGMGLSELKDLLWREINSEANMAASTITHRPLDRRHRVEEEDEFIFDQPETDDSYDEQELLTDEDWNEEFWDEEDSVNGPDNK
ncbi:MAG: GTPase ObgE, partial [Muribaculaceae bacterium]|nr:GTPase ObgE [Muribaculaceae bacterium]